MYCIVVRGSCLAPNFGTFCYDHFIRKNKKNKNKSTTKKNGLKYFLAGL